jgi:murein tripeptide amidase MpaA
MSDLGIEFGVYRTHGELYDAMKRLADAHPGLSELYSIGKSLQGRELWTMEITNHETGPAEEKPGLWIDGNTHSGEVTGSAVCLYTVGYLLENHGKDEFVTELLDNTAIYVLPRVNPDGAEIYLTRPYHRTGGGISNPDFEDGEGHYEEDVDGDGAIVYMRIRDPAGDWRISRKDPRLMLKRKPEDTEADGPYYKVLREGMFLKYKPGKEVTMAPKRYTGGTNRNYPAYWAPGGLPLGGAGPFPLWEREPRAIADFWADHPNLSGIHTFHTSGGLILRESTTKADSWFIDQGLEADIAVYKVLADMGKEQTGYPAISIYEDFTFEDDRPFRRGCATSFFYEQLGAFVFSVELWDWPRLLGHGGFMDRGGVDFSYSDLSEDDQLKELHWIDENYPAGFVDWHTYEHPQLGPVEIGGINTKYTRRNAPPGKWLEEEAERCMMFALRHAAMLPRLSIAEAKATKVAETVYKVEAQVKNLGFMATYVTQMGVKIKVSKPVTARIVLPEGAELVTGHEKADLGHLDGRSAKLLKPRVVGGEVIDRSRRNVEWVVKTASADPVELLLEVKCPRAGTDRKTITLS